MTIARIERLMRRVRGALQGSEAGGAQIAAELAEVCRETNRRIEECGGSLRRGDFGGALDLSEADPPLGEQIRVLSGTDLEPWRQKCRDQGWPVPEAPDLAAFQGLQKSLREARGKETDPSLVESFRAAMVAGDRPAALRVLTTVLRRRPGDVWATGEKAKLLAKESEISLRRLEALLASGDSAALAAEVDKFEQLGLDARYRPEIYDSARERRMELRREEAQERVRHLLHEAEAKHSAGNWRETEEILETAAIELEEAGARPPAGNLWNELHQWVRQNRVESEQREQLRKQEETVERELDVLEGLRQEGVRRSPSRLRESLETVEGFLRLAGSGGTMWPESIYRRLREEAEGLSSDLRRARRKRRLLAGGAAIMVFAVGLVVWQWKQEEIRQELFLLEIDGMISGKKVDEAKAWLASEEARKAGGQARGAAELAKLRSFLEQEEELRRSAEEELAKLEEPSSEKISVRWQAWEEFGKRLAAVHPRWRGGLEERKERALAELRRESGAETEKRARGLREIVKQVEGDFAAWEKTNKNRAEDAARLTPMLEKLTDGDAWQKEVRPELVMPEDLQKEFQALKTKVRQQQDLIDDFLKARLGMVDAARTGDYRAALERVAESPLLSAEEKEKAGQVLTGWMGESETLAALWLPWLKPLPVALSGGKAQLAPARLEASEDAILKEIAEDDFLHDIWAYDVPRAKDTLQTYRLYARGKLQEIPGSGREEPYIFGRGEVFIPEQCARDGVVEFETRPRRHGLMGIEGDSEKMLVGFRGSVRPIPETNAVRLRAVRDSLEEALSSGKALPLARAPIHEALQNLLPNASGASPLARAYLAGKVWKLATVAQDPTRFGLGFSPSLQRASTAWSGWGPVEPGVWLKEDVAGIDPHWVESFSLPGNPRFVDEAKLVAHLWTRAGKSGLSFGGGADPEGKTDFKRLVNLEPGQVLVGQGLKGDPVVGWRFEGKNWQGVTPVRPYSPLYLMPRSPESFLQESLREARVEEGWARDWLRRELPVLFGGGR